MADDNQQVCEEPRSQQQHGGAISFAAAVMTAINRGVAAVFNAATRDGTLAAAFRQGASEIGQALKAFPDSISAQEPGTILSPTQGEIAEARDAHTPIHAPSPSDIARGQATVHGQQQSNVQAPPSPSDIARGNGDTVHGQQQGNGQAAPSPSDIARGNGQVLEQGKPPDMGWAEWIEQQRKGNQDGNAENDQSEREKGRSLPDEQKEKQKEQEQDRGRGR
jgi:hypothetical protein